MTESMRTRVESAVKESNGALTIEFAKTAIAQKEKTISYWNSLPAWKQGYTAKCVVAAAQADIEYFEAVVEYLTEVAATEAVAETVQVLAAIVTVSVASKAKAVRRAVATLANKLHRLSYSLSDAFRRSWALIKAFNGLLPALS